MEDKDSKESIKENKEIYYKRGTAEHKKYYIEQQNKINNNIKNNNNEVKLPEYDKSILKKNLCLWKETIKEVFGENNLKKIIDVINNIEIEKYRNPFLLYHISLHMDNNNDEDNNNNKLTKKEYYNENKTTMKKDANNWVNNLPNNEKEKFNEMSQVERIIFKCVITILKHFLFMGFNCFKKNRHDNLIYKVYEALEIIEYYNTYIKRKVIDLNMKNIIKSRWNKYVLNCDKKRLKKIITAEKKICDEAVNYNNKKINTIFKEEKDNIKLDKKYENSKFDNLPNKTKDFIYQKKEEQNKRNEILININLLKNKKSLHVPDDPITLFEQDIKNNFNNCKNINSIQLIKLWENCDTSLKALYKEKIKRMKLEKFFLDYEINKTNIIKKRSMVPDFDTKKAKMKILNKDKPEKEKIKLNEVDEKYNELTLKEKEAMKEEIKILQKEHHDYYKNYPKFNIPRKISKNEIMLKLFKQYINQVNTEENNNNIFTKTNNWYNSLPNKEQKLIDDICYIILKNQNRNFNDIKKCGAYFSSAFNWFFQRSKTKIPDILKYLQEMYKIFLEDKKDNNQNENNEINENEINNDNTKDIDLNYFNTIFTPHKEEHKEDNINNTNNININNNKNITRKNSNNSNNNKVTVFKTREDLIRFVKQHRDKNKNISSDKYNKNNQSNINNKNKITNKTLNNTQNKYKKIITDEDEEELDKTYKSKNKEKVNDKLLTKKRKRNVDDNIIIKGNNIIINKNILNININEIKNKKRKFK